MKNVTFAKTWRETLSPTSYREHPAGASLVVSDAVAAAAKADGALKGEPTDAEEPSDKAPAKAPAKKA